MRFNLLSYAFHVTDHLNDPITLRSSESSVVLIFTFAALFHFRIPRTSASIFLLQLAPIHRVTSAIVRTSFEPKLSQRQFVGATNVVPSSTHSILP